MPRLDFYFDPSCEWTWNTSRWITEVAPARDVRVTWRPLSLSLLNEGKELPEEMPAELRELITGLHRISLAGLRVMEAVRAEHGDEPIGRLYTEYGRRIHHDRTAGEPTFLTDSLTAAGLDAGYAAAADDDRWDEPLRAGIREVREQVGDDVGSPVLVYDTEPRRGFSGPVVSPPPTGEDALTLWDSMYAIAGVPGVYEIKRSREGGAELPPRP